MDGHERSLLRELLKHSDQRCKKLVELTEEGVWVFNREDATVFANSEMSRMLGYSPAEMLRVPTRQFMAEAEPGSVTDDLITLLRTGGRAQNEIRLRHRDQSEVWVGVTLYPLFAQNGELAGRVGVFTNTTARKRAERALRESERRYHDLFANAPVGIYRTTSDGLISMANQALVSMLGYTSFEELTGQNLDEEGCGPIYQREAFRAQIERDGETRGVESVWKRRDKSVLFVRENAKLVRDANGKILYFEGTVEDITERKLAEEKLQQSEARLRSLINNAPFGIYQCDPRTDRLLDVNPALVEMLGYTSKLELLAIEISRDLYADPVECEAFVHECRVSGRCESDMAWKRRDGKRLQVRARGRQSRQHDGDLRLEVYVEDISKRADLEQQLRQAQKMEAVGSLAGGVAHDFNNLLMIISSYTQMMEDELAPDDRLRQNTRQVLKAVERSSALIQQLLAFSRKQILSPRILDLNVVVEETAKMIRRLIGEDIELVLSLERPLWVVKADPDQIGQVLLNLCLNARDAMPRGGKLTISTKSSNIDGDGEGVMPGVAPGRYTRLTVSDDGIGMSQQVQSRIFEPFFTTKPLGKGTGLGLSMVYGIVRQSGGYIWVDSELDRGTAFQILFPAVDEVVSPVEFKASASELGQGETILLVEDEAALRESVAAYLSQHGYKVLEASNGEEALEVAARHPEKIHLLLTDVVMPRMEGTTLASQLATARPGITTLFMSGYTDHRVLQHLPETRRPAVLQKPLNLQTLVATIGAAMKASS
ncbi:MAG: PAS domain S-box protein [Candidatus Korobacteraceae bacterium]|jgi:PAS domain S-box-containing protein